MNKRDYPVQPDAFVVMNDGYPLGYGTCPRFGGSILCQGGAHRFRRRCDATTAVKRTARAMARVIGFSPNWIHAKTELADPARFQIIPQWDRDELLNFLAPKIRKGRAGK